MLGLRFCARAFSSRGRRGPLFIAVRGPPTITASPVAEHRLQTRRLSNCGSRAQPLRGMWDPPRPGLEPASPASAGRFPTAAPPGKPSFLYCLFICWGFLSLFMNIFSYTSLIIVIRATLKSLCTNSDIWDILGLVSVDCYLSWEWVTYFYSL